ncbi:MAG: DUF1365 domain-containing protein [Verrucomicrobiota bacterium]
MNSIYECTVFHRRLKPRRNEFTYRVFMLSVDVDALPALAKRHFGFSHNRFNLFSIDDRDHVNLGKGGGIRANLIAWLAGNGVDCPIDARIRLVTFPRVLGYGFNPVSFYYVESSGGEPIAAVAEVVNTFREMKLYFLGSANDAGSWHRRVAKDFYVSPFSDPGDEFDFKIGPAGDTWRVNIDNHTPDDCSLVSSIRGERRDFTTGMLWGCAIKYPLLSLKIIFLIHWHALRLWMRKVPLLRKSERREAQLDVLRPHESLTKNLP